MTEEELVLRFRGLVAGEKEHVLKAVRRGDWEEVRRLRYRLLHYFGAVHPDAQVLVDGWIAEGQK